MIKSVHLKNFQSHENSLLTFSDGVNVIVGPSDSGKSSILRAIRWVVENHPQGKELISHWSDGKSEVALILDNRGIVRSRTKSKNQYQAKGQTFDKVGRDVPSEIAKDINLDPDINAQWQHDAPFLLSLSPSDVGRILNRVARLEDIDSSMSNINSLARKVSTYLGIKQGELIEAEEALELFEGLDERDGKLAVWEGMSRRANQVRSDQVSINLALSQLAGTEREIERLQPLDKINIGHLMDEAKFHAEIIADIELISDLRERADDYEREAMYWAEIADVALPLKEVERYQEVRRARHQIEVALTNLEYNESKVVEMEEIILEEQGRFDELMPDACPLCERSCDCG